MIRITPGQMGIESSGRSSPRLIWRLVVAFWRDGFKAAVEVFGEGG